MTNPATYTIHSHLGLAQACAILGADYAWAERSIREVRYAQVAQYRIVKDDRAGFDIIRVKN